MELASNKMEQVQYDGIVSYLRTGSFPSSMTKNEKDSLRRKAKNFLVKDGLLFYRDKKKAADLQVLNRASFLFFVLHDSHSINHDLLYCIDFW